MKQMSKQKILGLTLDVGLLISILFVNDVTYLKFVGIVAILVLIGDTLFNKM
jgi:general stress protein CsbA